jgi:ABC-type ATPase with predicted acetyltransferase domain
MRSADKAIVSHFNNPEDAIDKLSAVGLNSVPSWYKPYHVLSTGEKFRADLARKLRDGAVIDEFTSVVDRNVAKAASVAMSKHIKRTGLSNIVIVTCHRDILDWLEPDWVIDTDTGHMYDGFFLSDRKYSWTYIEQIERYGQCLKTIII